MNKKIKLHNLILFISVLFIGSFLFSYKTSQASPPGGFTLWVSNCNNESYDLNWSSSSGVWKYWVFSHAWSGGGWGLSGDTTGTSFHWGPAGGRGTHMYFTVSADNGAGEFTFSNEVQANACSYNCVGSWGACNNGSQTYTISSDRINGGSDCPYSNGATQACASTPSASNVTISSSTVVPNNSNQYNIVISGTDPGGASRITNEYALINYQGENAGSYRGYLTWAYIDIWPGYQDHKLCSGLGGYAVIQPGYGNTYTHLDSCNVTNSGNTKTVTFTVHFDSSFINPVNDNDISGYVANSYNNYLGWVNFQTNFNLNVPVNCVGSWGTCSNGSQTYSITTNAAFGGSSCPYSSGATQACGTPAQCSATHYNCISGNSANNSTSINDFTWNCNSANGGTNATCSETIPPPTNLNGSCANNGSSATASWSLPTGYSLSYFRIVDVTTGSNLPAFIPENISDPGPSTSFATTPGHSYSWWVHTRVPSGAYSTSVASTFSCPDLPTVSNVTISSNTIIPNNSNQYNIVVSGTDLGGAAKIAHEYALINLQGENAGSYRGYLTWASVDTWPGGQDHKLCSGVGSYAVIQPSGYGNTYIHLDSCNVVDSGNTRTVTFTVHFDPSFITPATDNDISGHVGDIYGNNTNWINFDTNFDTSLPINGACSSTHYNCNTGTPLNQKVGPSKWTWSCIGYGSNHKNASCSERNIPKYKEN